MLRSRVLVAECFLIAGLKLGTAEAVVLVTVVLNFEGANQRRNPARVSPTPSLFKAVQNPGSVGIAAASRIQRVIDHDGTKPGDGGIERWLKLTDGLGLDRELVKSTDALLPGTRFAVDCYVTYVKEHSVLEGMTSSLTELFAPSIHRERIAGMLKNYDFIHDDIMAYFKKRLDQAPRDVEHVLELALLWPESRAEQQGVIDSLIFKLDCLWAQQDALYEAYVEGHIPPGAFVPEDFDDRPRFD